jgi:acetyl-CoA carboxylase biotin carboxyl carrier protein
MGADQNSMDAQQSFALQAMREIVALMNDTDISEITFEQGELKLRVKRGGPAAQSPQQLLVTPSLATFHPTAGAPLPPAPAFQPSPAGVAAPAAAEPEDVPEGRAVTAPMVGTFYRAPSPKDAPYVEEGDVIQAGDRVGIIEAMKMMNEIESDVAGRVVRVLVKNGQPVEYGQPLIIVEPV